MKFCILPDHFHKCVFYNASHSVHILETFEGNGRTARNTLDTPITSRRKQLEKTWIVKLKTVYPYGLNDHLVDEYDKNDMYVLLENKFLPLPRKHDRFYRETIKNIKNIVIIKNIAVLLQDNLDDLHNLYIQWSSPALDIIESKIFKPSISKAKRKAPTNICKISFLNKALELIKVPHIFHDSSVKACLPTDIKSDDHTVLY